MGTTVGPQTSSCTTIDGPGQGRPACLSPTAHIASLTMVALTEHHQSSMCQWCQILYQPQKKPRTVTKTSFRLSLRSSASSLWDHQIQELLALPSHRDVKCDQDTGRRRWSSELYSGVPLTSTPLVT